MLGDLAKRFRLLSWHDAIAAWGRFLFQEFAGWTTAMERYAMEMERNFYTHL